MEKKRVIIIVISLALFSAFMYSGLIWVILEDKQIIKEAHDKSLQEQSLNTTCSYKRDSLNKEVIQLSVYKSLTKAMVARDEAVNLLPHKVGDVVYTKNDSSKAVIEDVLLGGSKYNYYVKYKLLLKDNTTREITPELIY